MTGATFLKSGGCGFQETAAWKVNMRNINSHRAGFSFRSEAEFPDILEQFPTFTPVVFT